MGLYEAKMDMGRKIEAARKQKGWSTHRLAKKLRVGSYRIYRMERGEVLELNVLFLIALCGHLDLKFSELFARAERDLVPTRPTPLFGTILVPGKWKVQSIKAIRIPSQKGGRHAHSHR